MTEQNLIKSSRAEDFKGFIGAVTALSIWIFPSIGGLSPSLVAASSALQKNLALFAIAGCIALAAAVLKLIWGTRLDLPAFFYAGPFMTLALGFLVWGWCLIFGASTPSHGIAETMRGMFSAVSDSADGRVLYGLLFLGALMGLWGGVSGLKNDLTGQCAVVALVFVIFSVSSELAPNFLTADSLVNIVRQVSYSGIIALGMTFVVVSGGVDLSVGSLSALLGCALTASINGCVSVWGDGGAAAVCAFLAALVTGAALGFASGFISCRARIETFLFTFGVMVLYRSLAVYAVDGRDFIMSKSAVFQRIGGGDPFLAVPYSIWVFVILAVLGAILLSQTRFGRHVTAVGLNETAAAYAGIDVSVVRAVSFALSGMTVGLSAFLEVGRLGVVAPASYGAGVEMDVIAAALIGGGSVFGTVAGAFFMGLLNNNLITMGISSSINGAVKAIILIAVFAVRKKN